MYNVIIEGKKRRKILKCFKFNVLPLLYGFVFTKRFQILFYQLQSLPNYEQTMKVIKF